MRLRKWISMPVATVHCKAWSSLRYGFGLPLPGAFDHHDEFPSPTRNDPYGDICKMRSENRGPAKIVS